jgi:hypothetical protein
MSHTFLNLVPRPDIVYLMDVPEEIAFRRKNDIPSLAYLSNRRALYHRIYANGSCCLLSGLCPLKSLSDRTVNDILRIIERNAYGNEKIERCKHEVLRNRESGSVN